MFGLDDANPRVQRIVQAVALGFGIAFAVMSVHDGLVWTDGQVYWEAGERMASGLPLYPVDANPETAYKYAPWFAWAWAPLTLLPESLVAAAWTVAMLLCWAVPVAAYLRSGWGPRAVALLAAPPLLVAALGGNVQPAIVALLFAGLARSWGPAAIGVAASLKFFPLIFVVVYLGRREWARAGMAVGLSGALILPALASEVGNYPADVGGAFSLLEISPIVYVAALLGTVAWTWRQSSWPAASVSVVIGSSVRFIPYHLGYLLCAQPQTALSRTPTAASGSSTAASTGWRPGWRAPDDRAT